MFVYVYVCVIQSKKGFVIVSGGIADRLIVILVMQLIISSYGPKIPICTALQESNESNLFAQCTAEAIKSDQICTRDASTQLASFAPMFSHVHLPIYSASFRITLHYLLPLLSSFLLVYVCFAFCLQTNRGDSFTCPSVCLKKDICDSLRDFSAMICCFMDFGLSFRCRFWDGSPVPGLKLMCPLVAVALSYHNGCWGYSVQYHPGLFSRKHESKLLTRYWILSPWSVSKGML